MGIFNSKCYKENNKQKIKNVPSSKGHYYDCPKYDQLEQQITIPNSSYNQQRQTTQSLPIPNQQSHTLYNTCTTISLPQNSSTSPTQHRSQLSQTPPTPKQKHNIIHSHHNNGLLTETFKNIPKNLQNNRSYITVNQSGMLICNLCRCEMTSNSLTAHFQGRKHLGYLPRAYLEAQAKWSHQRRSQLSLNEILGGVCLVCNIKIPNNRMFVEHCKGRKHQTRLIN